MKIRTQFIIIMALLIAALLVATTAAVFTHRQIQRTGSQERIAVGIAHGADELGYLANDYLIHRENQQLKRWQSRFATFSEQVASLDVDEPEQQFLVASIRTSQDRMKEVFDSLSSASAGTAVLELAFLKVSWNRMAVQSQALAADAMHLSQILRGQTEQLTNARTILMYVLVGLFGFLLLTSYLFTYRRILRSVTKLQAGTAIIGSGNLDFTVEDGQNDELGTLSQAFNQMAADLKAVTASKADLLREMDERQRTEEELQRQREWLSVTLASIGDAVIATDTDGRITFMNPIAEALTGWALSDATQKPIKAVFNIINAETRREADDPVGKVLREGRIVGLANHTLLVRRDGTEIPIDDSAAPIKSPQGRTFGAILVFRDITERSEVERCQAEHAAQMEEINKELEETNKELESFSYSVSHDLRAPLRAIAGFARMLVKKEGERFDEETRRRFQVIMDNVEKMGRLIDDLLAFSRTGRQEMSRRAIDMEELIRDVWQELASIHPDRQASIKVDLMPAPLGDRTLIRQVYANLLGNAFKFTQGRDTAVVEVGSYIKDNETVYYVRDNGIGFDMRYYEKLFGVFQRLHSYAEYEGTGIGLAIVKRIINRHGGRVWAEGEVDRGATFYFTLPLRQE